MDRTRKIMRKSISTFLKHFQYFTTTPVLLLLPFSASVLISQPLFNSASSKFTSISSSIFIIPFALSSLLVAKLSVIRYLDHNKLPSSPPPFSSFLTLYKPLLLTSLFSMVINITSTFLLLRIFSSFAHRSFGLFDAVFQAVCGLVVHAFMTNIKLVCNLAFVVAGMENCSGYRAIHKAYLLRKGRNDNSMTLIFWAFPANLGLASVEALFSFRIVRSYLLSERTNLSMALEGMLIACIYSVIIVLDTIACCIFIKSCRSDPSTEISNGFCNQIELV